MFKILEKPGEVFFVYFQIFFVSLSKESLKHWHKITILFFSITIITYSITINSFFEYHFCGSENLSFIFFACVSSTWFNFVHLAFMNHKPRKMAWSNWLLLLFSILTFLKNVNVPSAKHKITCRAKITVQLRWFKMLATKILVSFCKTIEKKLEDRKKAQKSSWHSKVSIFILNPNHSQKEININFHLILNEPSDIRFGFKTCFMVIFLPVTSSSSHRARNKRRKSLQMYLHLHFLLAIRYYPLNQKRIWNGSLIHHVRWKLNPFGHFSETKHLISLDLSFFLYHSELKVMYSHRKSKLQLFDFNGKIRTFSSRFVCFLSQYLKCRVQILTKSRWNCLKGAYQGQILKNFVLKA